MTDEIERQIIEIIQDTLRNAGDDPAVTISAHDSMDTVPVWDSVTFMAVFLAINEAFSVSPDFDDAIHYTSVSTLCDYLRRQAA